MYDDIDHNDPDLHDAPRCRHRDGDPDCDCPPDPEQEQRDRKAVADWASKWLEAMPAMPDIATENVSERLSDVQIDVEELLLKLMTEGGK